MATRLNDYSYIDCKCLNVVDGDTIDALVLVDIGFKVIASTVQRFRLLGVNTPEMRPRTSKYPDEATRQQVKKAAVKARDFVQEKLKDKKIRIITAKSDAFGRYLATIYYKDEDGEVDLNQQLLELGLAVPYKR